MINTITEKLIVPKEEELIYSKKLDKWIPKSQVNKIRMNRTLGILTVVALSAFANKLYKKYRKPSEERKQDLKDKIKTYDKIIRDLKSKKQQVKNNKESLNNLNNEIIRWETKKKKVINKLQNLKESAIKLFLECLEERSLMIIGNKAGITGIKLMIQKWERALENLLRQRKFAKGKDLGKLNSDIGSIQRKIEALTSKLKTA
jgi:predicted nuclease with TOPRIM domain